MGLMLFVIMLHISAIYGKGSISIVSLERYVTIAGNSFCFTSFKAGWASDVSSGVLTFFSDDYL